MFHKQSLNIVEESYITENIKNNSISIVMASDISMTSASVILFIAKDVI